MALSRNQNEIIKKLLGEFAGRQNLDLSREMIQSSVSLLRDNAKRLDFKVLNKALKELRYAFKAFAPYSHRKKVSTFGSARVPKDTPEYRMAYEFGRKIAAQGFMAITGAGPGIMEAVQRGAGRECGFGLNISLPSEEQTNSIIKGDSKLITFKYFFTRKLMFVKETDAIVCFPGGFGTMDEAFECLTLMQTGKSYIIPIVLVDTPEGDYWQSWDEFISRHMLSRALISAEDRHLYLITHSIDRACEEIMRFYRVYNSMRYLDRFTILRLNRSLSKNLVGQLNEEFGDILVDGHFEYHTKPLLEENANPDIDKLPRLVFPFDRQNMGRLRQVINRINNDAS